MSFEEVVVSDPREVVEPNPRKVVNEDFAPKRGILCKSYRG